MLGLFNPDTGESPRLELPAEGWSGLGEPAGSRGYVYRDAAGDLGACSRVRLLDGQRLDVLCRASELGFTLDERRQGRLGLMLETGTQPGSSRYCMEFGGQVLRDRRRFWWLPGVFLSLHAPRAPGCPAGF